MSDQPNTAHPTAWLLASQRTYYNERADDYGDPSKPDRKGGGMMKPELCRALIDELRPAGDVLELACGTGFFTADLARHAQSVTAVGASQSPVLPCSVIRFFLSSSPCPTIEACHTIPDPGPGRSAATPAKIPFFCKTNSGSQMANG